MHQVIHTFTDASFITWTTPDQIRKAVIEHYQGDKTYQYLQERVRQAWQDKRSLNLIDGTRLTKVSGDPFEAFIEACSNAVIKAIDPDIWTDEHEMDYPDYMRLERLGVVCVDPPEWYAEGKTRHPLSVVTDKLGLRSVIRCYDEAV